MTTIATPDISAFLTEDLGTGDLTANLIPAGMQASAEVITREDTLICGQAWFNAVFTHLDPTIRLDWQVSEGSLVPAGSSLCHLNGSARALLSGERTALNLLQTLSATATLARHYADAIAGTGCQILDTRKTIPGLRAAQKYAVRCGGCVNHRQGLYDAILIKENHIKVAGSITKAVRMARLLSSAMVEVEVESLTELEEALHIQPDRIMLDNFSLPELREAVALNAGRIELEASGNIRLDTIRAVAETGVNFISIGALTKDIRAIDLSMRIHLVTGYV